MAATTIVTVNSWKTSRCTLGGEESYDGLGDALQERGDELNDETFGGTGAVGGFQFDSCSFGGLLAVEWLIGGCFGFRKGF